MDLGLVNAEQVAETRAEAQASGVGVVDLMLANKLIRAADVTQAKAAQFGAEVVQLAGIQIPDDVIDIIPRHIAKKYRVVPVFKTEGKVAVAIADPSDLNTIDTLTHLLNAEIELRVASEPDIESALNKYYGGEKRSIVEDSRFKDVIQELTEENVEATLPGADDGGAAAEGGRRISLLRPCANRSGTALNQRQQFSGSEAALRKAMECDPDYLDTYNELGQLYFDEKKYAESQAVLQQGLRRSPQSWQFYFQIGGDDYHLGKYAAAGRSS